MLDRQEINYRGLYHYQIGSLRQDVRRWNQAARLGDEKAADGEKKSLNIYINQ